MLRQTFARPLEIESNHPSERRRPSTGRLRSHANSQLGSSSRRRRGCAQRRRGHILSIVCATSTLAEEQFQVVDEDGKSSRNLSPTVLGWANIRNPASAVTRKPTRREASGIERATKLTGLCSPRTATSCAGDGTP